MFSQICNSKNFHRLHQHEVLQIRSDLDIPETSKFPTPVDLTSDTRNWNIIETPKNLSETRLTSGGVEMQYDSVPEGVIAAQEYFYVCVGCGKFYWGKRIHILLDSHFECFYLQGGAICRKY